MLGAEEVDRAIGRLVGNPFADFLPLLGAFVVAGNRFVQPVPGIVLYNISDGIMATDVSGWLTRWLMKQELQWNTSTYIWGSRQIDRSYWQENVQALTIGAVLNAGLLVLTIFVNDWFGFANTTALILSVAVRWYMIDQNRAFLDKTVKDLDKTQLEFVKVFCILPDGRAVTLHAPRGMVRMAFLTRPRPYGALQYTACRTIGWIAFGLHVICIGQATLFIQILTVFIMVSATTTCILGVGSDEHKIGRKIHVHLVTDEGIEDRRTVSYARLGLSDDEDRSMLAWGLFPQSSNERWWHDYQQLKKEIASGETNHAPEPCDGLLR
ncbi:MAG: hypothetical protein Q9160_008016 [Pyrenula sp. 1 TL-2023]